MKASQMIPSRFLKKEDVEEDTLCTIKSLDQDDVSAELGKSEMKWVVTFAEFDKPMVLNVSNINALIEACGTDETDEWVGKKCVVYVDPNVMYAGKRVGGLRIRKAKNQAKVVPRNVDPDEAAAAQYEGTRKTRPLGANDVGDDLPEF